MILYKMELKTNLKTFLTWTIVILVLLGVFLALFPSYASQGDQINKMVEQLPKEMTNALSMQGMDFTNPVDYTAYMFQYIVLAAGIMSMLIGIGIISKEEGEGTIEFLYSKPITRNYIVTSKIFSALTQIIVFPVLTTLLTYGVMKMVSDKDFSGKSILLMGVGLFFIQLYFLSIGLLISIFITKIKKNMSISLAIVFTMYFVSMMCGVNEKLKNLKYITPFKYFETSTIVEKSQIDIKYIFITIIITLVCVFGTYVLYNKKDIN